jgi:hypothetical protein
MKVARVRDERRCLAASAHKTIAEANRGNGKQFAEQVGRRRWCAAETENLPHWRFGSDIGMGPTLRLGSEADMVAPICDVRFSNRPVRVKHFQTTHHYSVDVTRGLVLLFGIGAKALPSFSGT